MAEAAEGVEEGVEEPWVSRREIENDQHARNLQDRLAYMRRGRRAGRASELAEIGEEQKFPAAPRVNPVQEG